MLVFREEWKYIICMCNSSNKKNFQGVSCLEFILVFILTFCLYILMFHPPEYSNSNLKILSFIYLNFVTSQGLWILYTLKFDHCVYWETKNSLETFSSQFENFILLLSQMKTKRPKTVVGLCSSVPCLPPASTIPLAALVLKRSHVVCRLQR